MKMEVEKATDVAKKRMLAQRMSWQAAAPVKESHRIPDVDIVRIICATIGQRKIRGHEFRGLTVDPQAFTTLWEAMGVPESIALSPEWIGGWFITTLVEKDHSYGVILEALLCGFRCGPGPMTEHRPKGGAAIEDRLDLRAIKTCLGRDRPDLALLLISTFSEEQIVALGVPAMVFIYDILKLKDEKSVLYEKLAPGISEMLRLPSPSPMA